MKMNANERVGKWTLLAQLPDCGRWVCRCDCGTVRQVLLKNLKDGSSKSCGCARVAMHQAVMRSAFPEASYGPR